MNESAEAVLELLPKNGTRLSGSQVKATLGLRDQEYKDAKAELKSAGLVIVGRGRSGTIALASPTEEGSETPLNILTIGERASAALWEDVKKRKAWNHCHCDLRPNMTYEELLELAEGCTGSIQKAERLEITSWTAGTMKGWVCGVLDFYRHSMYKYRIQKEEIFDEDQDSF